MLFFKNTLSFLSRVIKNAPLTLLLVMALSPAVRASVNAVEHINYIENKMNYLITADQFILAWNKVKTIGIDFEAELDQISSFDPCSTNCSLEMTTQGATHYKIYDDLVDIRYVAYYNVDKGELLGVGQYISQVDINGLNNCAIAICGMNNLAANGAVFYTHYNLVNGQYLLAIYDGAGGLLYTDVLDSPYSTSDVDSGILQVNVNSLSNCTISICGLNDIVSNGVAFYTYYKLVNGKYLFATYDASGKLLSSEVVDSPNSILVVDSGTVTTNTVDTAVLHTQPSYLKAWVYPTVDPTRDIVGRIKGQYGVSPAGKAYYSVPVKVPSGVLPELAPNLSVAYSSGADAGLLGQAWRLNGLSKIYRCASTLHQAGKVVGTGDGGDKFCVDGQQLLQTTTNTDYFAVGSQYHSVMDTHTRYELKAGGYIEARTKAGHIIEYGKSDDASVIQNGKKVLLAVDKVHHQSLGGVSSDRNKLVDYSYLKENGYPYISAISYANVSVEFDYIAAKVNNSVRYGAYSGKVSKRLDSITSRLGSVFTHRYKFGYAYASSSFGYFLKTIEECGFDDAGFDEKCSEPLSIDWLYEESMAPEFRLQEQFESENNIQAIYPAQLDADRDIEIVTEGFGRIQIYGIEHNQSSDDAYVLKQESQGGITYNDMGQVIGLSDPVGERVKYSSPLFVDHDQDGIQELYFNKISYLATSKETTTPVINPGGGCAEEKNFLLATVNGQDVYEDFNFDKTETINGVLYCRYLSETVGSAGRLIRRTVAPQQPFVENIVTTKIYNTNLKHVLMRLANKTGDEGDQERFHQYTSFDGNSSGDSSLIGKYFTNFSSDDYFSGVTLNYNGDDSPNMALPYYAFTDSNKPRSLGVFKRTPSENFSHYSMDVQSAVDVLDFDKDGQEDMLAIDENGFLSVHVNLAERDYSYPYNPPRGEMLYTKIDIGQLSPLMNKKNMFLHDVNNDGYKDIHFANGDYIAYFLGKLNGFDSELNQTPIKTNNVFKFKNRSQFPQDGLIVQKRYQLADIDNDGNTDIIFPNDETNTYAVWLGNGASWAEKVNLDIEIRNTKDAFSVFDYDGDGMADVIQAYYQEGDKGYEWYRGVGWPRKAVRTLNDGLGLSVSFTHGSIGDQANYEDRQTHRWPTPSSYYAVKDMVVEAKNAKKNIVSYKYKNGYIDGKGLGFLGFEEVAATNKTYNGSAVVDERITTTAYHQEYPLIGRPIETVNEYANTPGDSNSAKTLINKSRFTYQAPATFNGTAAAIYNKNLMPYVESQRSISYEGASIVSVQDVVKEYHDTAANPLQYGNVKKVTTRIAAGENASQELQSIQHTVVQENTTYSNNAADWRIGFPNTTVSTATQGTDVRTITTSLEAKPNTLLLAKQTDHVGDSKLERITEHFYTDNGLLEKTTVAGTSTTYPVPKRTVYDASSFDESRYPTTLKNAFSHEVTLVNDLRFGLPYKQTDANDNISYITYDPLGREIEVLDNNTSVASKTKFEKCDDICHAVATYKVTKSATNIADIIHVQPQTTIYFDALDRTVREEVVGFADNTVNKVDTSYDARGNVASVSEPYAGATALHTTNFVEYDRLNRLKEKTSADGGKVILAYSSNAAGGRNIVTTHTVKGSQLDSAGNASAKVETSQSNTKVENALGQLVSVTDAMTTETIFEYDALGNLEKTRIAANADTDVTATFDNAGNKVAMTDPDTGTYSYGYDALGQLRKQTDAKAQELTMSYDLLGRLQSRKDGAASNAPVSTWIYDTADNGKGLLHCVADKAISACTESATNYKELYSYDSASRPSTSVTTLTAGGATKNYSTGTSYDRMGRLDTVTYPSGLKVGNAFKNNGYLHKQFDAVDNTVYQEITAMNARSQVAATSYGNGQQSTWTYRAENGRLSSISTLKTGGATAQGLSYSFDTLGNLDWRKSGNGLYEDFGYDALNRLTTTQLGSNAAQSNAYTPLGNIQSKAGVAGTYGYYNGTDGAGIHAVKTANGLTYNYDANGNMTEVRNGNNDLVRDIDYSLFNKPIRIAANGAVNTFNYSPERSRYYQSLTEGSSTTQTYYAMGGAFEEVVENGVSTQKTYVGDFLLHTKVGGIESIQYTHRDHLGSVEAITNDDGTVAQRLSFEAFGARRDGSDWDGAADTNVADNTTRGFTDHEHLDAVGLIHMNGRVYDPVIGRFLSPDIVIQFPEFSQSYNRYSYVLNNPLGFVDPSGWFLTGPSYGPQRMLTDYYNNLEATVMSWFVGAPVAVGSIPYVVGGGAAMVYGAAQFTAMAGAAATYSTVYANTFLLTSSAPEISALAYSGTLYGLVGLGLETGLSVGDERFYPGVSSGDDFVLDVVNLVGPLVNAYSEYEALTSTDSMDFSAFELTGTTEFENDFENMTFINDMNSQQGNFDYHINHGVNNVFDFQTQYLNYTGELNIEQMSEVGAQGWR